MPLKLDIKRRFTQRSERVKGVDLHPTEPWLLVNLYNGTVCIYSTADGSLLKSWEVTDLPVRAAAFIPRRQWVATGADDCHIRVYNVHTLARERAWEAHADYIRAVAPHPTLPILLSASDDMTVKAWDWERGWACTQVFEGHSHYVMALAINPKDPATFATASLDRTVKVWSLGSPIPNFTLEGHAKGVNAVAYCPGGDRPYLISGADDRTARVWDYQTKATVTVLEGHAHNVSAVAFHPELPLIVTGSEDGAARLWHATTYRLEACLSYGLERLWAVSVTPGSNAIALGYDDGTVLAAAGRDDPVASMDGSGKLVWARQAEVMTANVKALGPDALAAAEDGERLPLPAKELGTTDVYPQALAHSPNGRFVAVTGDGEWCVYTALAWRAKAYGAGLDFAWADDSSSFAVRESPGVVKLYHAFKEAGTLRLGYAADGLAGGALLAVRSEACVVFYDWDSGAVIQRVDIAGPRLVAWSEPRGSVAVLAEGGGYVLDYDAAAVAAAAAAGTADEADGVDGAFALAYEIPDGGRASSAAWVGDCLLYVTGGPAGGGPGAPGPPGGGGGGGGGAGRLAACVGGDASTVAHLDRPGLALVGALAAAGKAFLVDRAGGLHPYALPLASIAYKTAVLGGADPDGPAAAAALEAVPPAERDGVARFLEARGRADLALAVATDDEYRFDLALATGDLGLAAGLAGQKATPAQWRALADAALAAGDFAAAAAALTAGADHAGRLLLAAALGDAAELAAVADAAGRDGAANVAFAARLALGDAAGCVALLRAAGRAPEAALLARGRAPSALGPALADWRKALGAVNPRAADALADPAEFPNLFPGWEEALAAEAARAGRGAGGAPAAGAKPANGVAPPPPPPQPASPKAPPKPASPKAPLQPASPKAPPKPASPKAPPPPPPPPPPAAVAPPPPAAPSPPAAPKAASPPAAPAPPPPPPAAAAAPPPPPPAAPAVPPPPPPAPPVPAPPPPPAPPVPAPPPPPAPPAGDDEEDDIDDLLAEGGFEDADDGTGAGAGAGADAGGFGEEDLDDDEWGVGG